ncbi:MAG: hypothetical protein Q8908_15045 [Bacteroidota bacterium]|nr:hypothetical protein [Bacteroidota bacterium]
MSVMDLYGRNRFDSFTGMYVPPQDRKPANAEVNNSQQAQQNTSSSNNGMSNSTTKKEKGEGKVRSAEGNPYNYPEGSYMRSTSISLTFGDNGSVAKVGGY